MIPPLSLRLATERLVLRPPRTQDVAEVRRMLRHNATHLKPWNPAPRPGEDPTSITEVSNTVLHQRREWKNGRTFVFMLALKDDPARFIGKIALSGVMRGAMYGAYLGYWMDVDHQNSGLCTEGLRAVIDFAFGPAALHRLQAAIMPHNARSLRVIEKLGFRREGYAERYLQIAGRWEDHILFARTSEEHTSEQHTNEQHTSEQHTNEEHTSEQHTSERAREEHTHEEHHPRDALAHE